MTLRLRLVIALVALSTVGLAIFGVVTYNLYARQQYGQLEEQLRSAIGPLSFGLAEQASLVGGPPRRAGGPPPGGGGVSVQMYGELREVATDHVVTFVEPTVYEARPELPATLDPEQLTSEQTFVVPSSGGGGEWLALGRPLDQAGVYAVVVAAPLDPAQAALDQLVLIEAAAATGLLVLLATGSWAILRHGLRPLEHMALTSRAIAAGDLSQRVSPAGDRTEVGQLGLVLNMMLHEIEKAFREREATEQRLRQFLADASHELRTPLTSIQGFAELFRLEQTPDHVSLEMMLRRIEEESARMKHLVEDLLLLAQLDETRPRDTTAVDLAVLAADACTDAVALDPDRPVTLDAPEPVVVLADEDHVRQAIGNLVANAVRHTPAGTPIEVSAKLGGGMARVEVRDHGPGLDDVARNHAFDRFWRADGARAGAGAGLGLAIVAAIAAEHGGTVTATNAPDGGAHFVFTLPLNPTATP